MSNFIPITAVAHEINQQYKRREHGLKTGEYIKYPDAEAKDHFVLKASKLYDAEGKLHAKGEALKEIMDQRLAMIALYRKEQEAKDVAPESESKNET